MVSSKMALLMESYLEMQIKNNGPFELILYKNSGESLVLSFDIKKDRFIIDKYQWYNFFR